MIQKNNDNDDGGEQNKHITYNGIEQEAVHNQTAKPWYGETKTWKSINDVDHTVENNVNNYEYNYVTFDIETTAKLPQRPLLAVAIDELSNEILVYLDEDHPQVEISINEAEKIIKNNIDGSLNIDFWTQNRKYMDNLLDHIYYYNQNDEINGEKTLVGHNIFFDLGIMGKDFDASVDESDPDSWDGVISYYNWSIKHKRAGADGRLYQIDRKSIPTNIPITDTQTVAGALRYPPALEDLSDELNVNYFEEEGGQEHGTVNKKYLKYNINDVISTQNVAHELRNTLRNDYNTKMDLSDVYSAASISKQKLREANLDRVHYSEEALKLALISYVGGQTEAMSIGEILKNKTYMDILSEYPTVAALMKIWEFVIAEEVKTREIGTEFLPQPSFEEFKQQEAWEQTMPYYVVIDSEDAMLPIRTEDPKTNTTKVQKGLVTHDQGGVVYHYMDVIAAKFYAQENNHECEINIKKAFKMEAVGQQDNLKNVTVGGVSIPATDNLMKKLIEERKRIQFEENDGDKDSRTKAVKVVANAMYGIMAERITKKRKSNNEILRNDEAGTYMNPHVASSITAAGRLMLSLGEITAVKNGGKMDYCDTDSLIVDNEVAEPVRDYFNSGMNPYDGIAGDLDVLEIEETSHPYLTEDGVDIRENDVDDPDMKTVELEDINILIAGVKKYAVMNKDNEILLSKEHGLGHFKQMRGDLSTKFWRNLISDYSDVVYVDDLLIEDMDKILTWQQSASTKIIRQQMSDLYNKYVRYGDWIERTVTTDDDLTQYIALDMESGPILKITTIEDTVDVEYIDSIENENVKTVRDLIYDWQTNIDMQNNGRRKYIITDTKLVTKEASDVVDVWNSKLEMALVDVNWDEMVGTKSKQKLEGDSGLSDFI